MVNEKRIVDLMREWLDLPDSITDSDIAKKSKHSLTWDFAKLSLAIDDLKQAFRKAIR